MPPLTPETLRGVWGTLLLPVQSDEGIDWGRLEDDLDHLAGAGLDGLYAHGTAGEFFTLTEREYERVNGLLAARSESAGVPFQIGAGHPSAQTCLERVRRAVPLAPSAIQVVLPDWLPLAPDEIVAFLSRVAEVARGVPLVLYNPPHAKTAVAPAVYARLRAEVPSMIGIKVLGGDGAWHRAVRAANPRLAVFVAGNRLASGVRLGAAGSYSNIACLNPAGARDWYRMMRTDPEAALDLEARIGSFLAAHVHPLQRAGFSDPALDKFLAGVGGWSRAGTRVRWPYRWVEPAAAEALRPVARSLLPELFPRA